MTELFRRWLRYALWLSCLCCASEGVLAQELRFHHLSQADGLPSDWVFALEQDALGFMWIGTDAGLARFDGYSTMVFKAGSDENASLLSNKIRALFNDSQGSLWIGSADGGVNRYDVDLDQFTTIALGPGGPHTVRSFAQTDSTWLIGTSEGLYEWRAGAVNADPITVTAELSINAILVDRYGVIWLGTGDGVYRYDSLGGGGMQRVEADYSESSRVLALTVDEQSTVWASIDQRLYALPAGATRFERRLAGRLPDVYITSLKSLQSGTLAIGTFEGLRLYDSRTDRLTAYRPESTTDGALSDGQVFSLTEDRTGSLWVGTYRGGVNFVNPSMLALGLVTQHGDCPIQAVKEAALGKDGLWLARTHDVLLLKSDGECKRYSLSVNDTSPQLSALGVFVDVKDNVWLRLDQKGLGRLDADSGRVVRTNTPELEGVTIASIAQTEPNSLWVGTESHGLMRLDSTSGSAVTVQGTGSLSVYEIQPWSDGLLLATNRGVLRYQPGINAISEPFELPQRVEVLSLATDESRQSIWIGTRSDGLYRADLASGSVHSVSSESGFQGETIRAVITDRSGNTWVGSNHGIFLLEAKKTQFRVFQTRDGLHGDTQYSGVYLPSLASVVFAGESGINRIKLSDLPRNQTVGNVMVTEVSQNGVSLLGPQRALPTVRFAHDLKDFSVRFALPHFDDASRNRYRYRLEGYDHEWIEVSSAERHANYTNLSAGRYAFQVMGANKDGVWGPASTGFEAIISPAWYATWWARLVTGLLVLMMLWLVGQYRTRKLTRNARWLSEQVAQRTAEIEEQTDTIQRLLAQKNELFAAISHEFRTPLTLIDGPLEQLATALPDGLRDKRVETIRFSSRRLLKLVDQLLRLATLDRDQIELTPVRLDLTLSALVAAFKPAAQGKGLSLHYHPSASAIWVTALPDAIETIIGNLLSNAIKYCPAGSAVELALEHDSQEAIVRVSDNGPGIAETEQNSVFERFYRASNAVNQQGAGLGLALARELAHAGGGDLVLRSEHHPGACFEARFPVSIESPSHLALPDDSSVAFEADGLLGTDPASLELEPGVEQYSDPSKLQVLVIDDDANLRQFIADVLDEYQCVTAPDGEEGIRQALESVPDLIVCDLMMPGVSGFDVVKAIRSDVRTSHIPFVLLTARVDQDSRLRGWRENVDDYLTKPFSAVELKSRLRNILAVRRILQQRFAHHVSESGAAHLSHDDVALLPESDARFMQRMTQSIERHYQSVEFGPEQLASDCAMSLRQLQRKLRALLGTSPADYLREFRLKTAARLLTEGLPAGRVADACGFSSASQFSRCFRARFDVSPSTYQGQSLDQKRRTFRQS